MAFVLDTTFTVDQNLSIAATDASNLTYLTNMIGGSAAFLGATWIPTIMVQLIETIIATVFFGLYTMLALAAVYLLLRRGKQTVTSAMLLAVIIIVYSSTTTYWVTILCELFKQISTLLQDIVFIATQVNEMEDIYGVAWPLLGGNVQYLPDLNATEPDWDFWWTRPTQECTGTASLTVNVILGDAIVWWRAWVLWRYSKTVRVSCIVLITATFITGVVATTHGCRSASSSVVLLEGASQAIELTPGSLYTGDSWGVAASVLSLVTNLTATTLIGYKAWLHRRLVASHLRSGSARTQAEQVLTLLVESGVIYCILWVFVVAYQALTIMNHFDSQGFSISIPYMFGFHYVVEGCLVSLIGMYPTLIIILVALNKSHCDSNFTYGGSEPDSHAEPTSIRLSARSGPSRNESYPTLYIEGLPGKGGSNASRMHASDDDLSRVESKNAASSASVA